MGNKYSPPLNGDLADPNRLHTDGDPNATPPIAPSIPVAATFNMPQLEIINAINAFLGAGADDKDDNTQLSQAIAAAVSAGSVPVNPATTDAAGIVELALQSEMNSGAAGVVPTADVVKAYVDSIVPHKVIQAQDQKTSGTAGGSSVSGDNVKTLNTVLKNDIAGASLASNKITLPAGDYYIDARSPSFRSNANKARLYNNTDAIDILIGSSEDTSSGTSMTVHSIICGYFTLADTKDLEIVHHISYAVGSNGLGSPTSSGPVEVYTDVKIWKVG